MILNRLPILLTLLLACGPAFAQIDLAGEWNNIVFEDQADRRNGPELGDFTGFPLNDAARLRAEMPTYASNWLYSNAISATQIECSRSFVFGVGLRMIWQDWKSALVIVVPENPVGTETVEVSGVGCFGHVLSYSLRS